MDLASRFIFGVIESLESGTDYIGKHMRKLLLIAGIIAVCVYWTEVSNLVTGYTSLANSSVKQWLVDHTPKK